MPLCPPDPRRCPKLSYVCETNGACRAFGRIGVDPNATKAPRDDEESKSRDEERGQEEATK